MRMFAVTKRAKDAIASRSMAFLTCAACAVFILLIYALFSKSYAILSSGPIKELIFGRDWFPLKGKFGFYPFIIGTLWVTLVAMAVAIPMSILTAIYLSEYAHRAVRNILTPLIDLLAAIPSVIYGVWGVLVIVPFIRKFLAPWFGLYSSGYCVLAAGIVLAIMVFPIIISVSREVLRAVPESVREASRAVGASHWQTVKYVVIRGAMPGIFAAVILGFARAFGETMAVLLVVGNVAKVPKSVFDPAYTLPTLIANNYGEMMSIPMYDSALMFSAFLLFLVIALFSVAARLILITTMSGRERRIVT